MSEDVHVEYRLDNYRCQIIFLSVRLSDIKVIFGLENKKLSKKLLVLESQNCYVKLRNI